MNRDFIAINRPWIGEEEVDVISKQVLSCRLTDWRPAGGEKVREFEDEMAKFVGSRHVVAVNSGTSAILASLLALGVKPGDEVVVPSFAFVSVANMVLLLGARPVFADITLDNYGLDPDSVRKKMTEKTRVVIVVHLYGQPALVEELVEMATGRAVHVIEDSAQALGTTIGGKHVGGFGSLGCFSTYPSKVITTAEGGFITTNDGELADKLRSIRTHGQREAYSSEVLGGNFRLPEVLAAMGLVQLKRLPEALRRRRRNARMLSEQLSDSGLVLPREGREERFNWNLFTVRTPRDDRDEIVDSLLEKGIGAAVYYRHPIHESSLYKTPGYREDLPNTEFAARRVFSLPVHPLATVDQMSYIAEMLRSLLR